MQKPIAFLLAASVILAGCGGWSTSRVNPRNWFGHGKSVPAATAAPASEANPLMPAERSSIFRKPEQKDLSVPIARVTELRIEPTISGAIIYAEGVAARQGPYKTELRPVTTPEDTKAGIMAFSFRVVYPKAETPVGNERSRTVHDAYSVTKQALAGVKMIRVSGSENALESRRR